MDAGSLLSHLTNLGDLRALVRAAGHAPCWLPLQPEGWPAPIRRAALVGRMGSAEWLAVEGPGLPARAAPLAHWLAGRGRMALVLALDPAARLLAIAVAVGRPVACHLALDRPDAAAQDILRRLIEAGTQTGLPFLLRATEVLTGEDAGRRFFAGFRDTVDHVAGALGPDLAPADRRSLALVQLTRVLFLYFVQAKGWLDGRPAFLRDAVDDHLARRRRLHRDLFRPLFFGTLNRRPADRRRARAFGRIPFLNGGLFEPHPLERVWRGDLPDSCWQAAFDHLFERYRFTVHEGGGPGAIAPDMLGRVFEGLMAPADRKDTGAYYTPAGLVARLVDAALAARLTSRLSLSLTDAERALAAREPAAVAALRDITLLDPAAGSGAFLLGALERLALLRRGEAPPHLLRREILARNLFGIDLNPMAVRLAELRLWLAVIADDPATAPESVAPLPNLDGIVRQGDALLDPARLLGQLGVRPRAGTSLGALRRAFVGATGADKPRLLRALRRAELATLEECLAGAARRVEGEIVDCLDAARAPTLFGERRGLDPELRAQLRRLRHQLGQVRRLHRTLRREGVVPWFQMECHFGDVLARGGFDVVAGNPPWVRAEQLPRRLRRALAERYRWWRGGGRGYAHQPDLALAFVERGFELTAAGGTLAFLVPAKLATAGYARRLRTALASQATLMVVADLSRDPAAAFDAVAYPAALVLTRQPPATDHAVRLSLAPGETAALPQRRFGAGPWVLAAPALLDAYAQVRGGWPALGERLCPRLGVKTGANAVFLEPPPWVEPSVVRRALRGRDAGPFRAAPGLRLLWAHDATGAPLPRLPRNAARYLRAHHALLSARADYRGGPPWTLFRTAPACAPHRVVWADLAARLEALPLSGPAAVHVVPLNSCYLIALPDATAAAALAAWLNSTWLRALARSTADPARGGFARFNARVVAELPLPPFVLGDVRLAALAARGARGEPVQEELDDYVADRLGLPPAACRVLAAAPGVAAPHRGRSADRS